MVDYWMSTVYLWAMSLPKKTLKSILKNTAFEGIKWYGFPFLYESKRIFSALQTFQIFNIIDFWSPQLKEISAPWTFILNFPSHDISFWLIKASFFIAVSNKTLNYFSISFHKPIFISIHSLPHYFLFFYTQ